MRLIGLTGGIATGKSTFSALLAEQGLPVIDADKVAKAIVRKGKWGYRRVVKAFGSDVLLPDGEIDRAQLGKIVFEDEAKRRQLNRATHPIVSLELLKQIVWHWLLFHWVVVVDVPLLFEGGLHKYASLCITVACDSQVQQQRLIARDGSTQQAANSRIAAQMPLQQKKAMSDIVIDNNGSREELAEKAKAVAAYLNRDVVWRGMLSSPLAVLLGLLALGSVLSRRWYTLKAAWGI